MDMIGSSNLQSALVLQAQSAFEQAASKLSLAEMQMVELRAQRLEGLQVHVAAVPRQVFPAHQTKSSGSNVGCSAGGGCIHHHMLRPWFAMLPGGISCCCYSGSMHHPILLFCFQTRQPKNAASNMSGCCIAGCRYC